ncbi:unnamed protein product [Porites lobata]|uniref:Apple domain-containing protein n=1 Tax=Porites lobata TaxID=104759 RepID=A0ABN8QHR5_9CNID|nr:unnamed protein product [Porites lobata]
MMAILPWFTQLFFLILNVFIGIIYSEMCGSVFESKNDHVLVGNIINTSVVADEFECHQKCLGHISCRSFNVHPGGDITKHVCELNNKTRQMKSVDFIEKSGSSFYGQVKVRSPGD